jgi:RNA polymerase sigma-70 factor (ECF subfamily)
MRERTDEALMQAYARGNLEAFEQLYARHRGPLYRYVLRQVGDAATANDLYQGAWEKIIRAREAYRPTAPFRAWMYRITRNVLMDHFRRAKPDAGIPVEDLASENPGPEHIGHDAQRAERLKEAISGLPPEQREALLLKLEGGFDVQAIAELVGVNRETAKSRLRYAVDKLKSTLKQ